MAALRIVSKMHVFVYRRTGGAIGGRILGNRVLLLTTTGRKTGRQRTTPMAYLTDGGALIVVAGAAGSAAHPAWRLNLETHPEATIQIRWQTLRVRASEATTEERQHLWMRYPVQRALFDAMRRRVARDIPVIVLRPENEPSQ